VGAQVGSTTDILTGVIRGPEKEPLEGAVVDATSLETQITRHAHTDAKGRYTIVFPDGGGQYRVTIRFVGMGESRFVISRQADEDRLVHDVDMSPSEQRLQEVTVVARNRGGNRDRPTPGSTERNVTGEQAAHLPIDASDPNAIAALAPGVVAIGSTDSTSSAFSVLGMRPTSNSVTLDGMTAGGASVPQDAVRSTRVITNTYDVARGQFTGGIVATTTRSGTNIPSGSFTYALRDKDLAWGGDPSDAFGQGYTQNQLGGGFGGPIVKDKFFVFGAVQGRWRDETAQTLLTADPTTLQRLGANPDSVARFLTLVNGYDVPLAPEDGGVARSTNNASAIVRFDWLLSDENTLMVRGDWRYSTQDPSRVSAYAVPAAAGDMGENGGGVMVMLTSHFANGIINELRAYASTDQTTVNPLLLLPAARVQVISSINDSLQAVSPLAFGGNASLPQASQTRMLEASDEASWLPGDASHRLKLGALVNLSRFDQNITIDRNGLFTYNSLADLEANQPASFVRQLTPEIREGTAINPAIYFGDSWRALRTLQLTYGARVEGSAFDGTPPFNPQVDSLFGLRTNDFPSEVKVTPRLGFTWQPGSSGGIGPSNWIIRGGGGEFRTPAPTSLFSAAEGATGLANTTQQLVCVGTDVPIPDWSAYLADPNSIPTTCAGGETTPGATAKPAVAAFAPDFGAPRAWRASFGVQHRLWDRYGISLDAGYARGVSLSGFRDVNLNTTPQFTLADEGNRPVYVPASSIIASTGAVNPFLSRVNSQYGQVIEIGSDLQSESEQLTFGFNGFTFSGLIFQFSYTYSNARDQNSYSGGSPTAGFAAATTGGDPNDREWAPSDYLRRHQFLLTATYPVTASLEITAIGRMTSGAPFTPLVGSDINGDGARNDRAFIFNPAVTADTGVAHAMSRLLTSAPGYVRDCLNSQIGQVASRNSCEGPWQPSFDLQINFRPDYFGLNHRLMISLSTVNLLAGVDQLVHGENDLHGWGVTYRPDPTLLYVTAFNPNTNEYIYSVNQRFGATTGLAAAYRVPFQIALQAHLVIGPDQTTDRLRSLFGAGGRRGGAASGGAEGAEANASDLASRFGRMVPNPATQILALKDSLALTDSQVTALSAVRDSLDQQNGILADSLRAKVDAAGQNPDPARLFAQMRPQLQAARANAQRTLKASEAILTKEQWAKVPDSIKSGGGRRGPPPP